MKTGTIIYIFTKTKQEIQNKELKKRIRKVPGVPIMFIAARKYTIERMPEAFGAPR